MGKKAGWIKAQIIPSDGISDGGTPYTQEEMKLMENESNKKEKIEKIKKEVADVVDEWAHNLLDKEGLENRIKELVEKMYSAKGIKPDPNIE